MGADKFGWVCGGKAAVVIPMGASEVIKALSGRFVTLDASGRGEISTAASTKIFGWVEGPEETLGATEGETKYNCIHDSTAVFRIPIISGTYTDALRGKTCDLAVSSDIQGAAVGTSARDIIRIVDGNAAEGWVDVCMVASAMDVAGVA